MFMVTSGASDHEYGKREQRAELAEKERRKTLSAAEQAALLNAETLKQTKRFADRANYLIGQSAEASMYGKTGKQARKERRKARKSAAKAGRVDPFPPPQYFTNENSNAVRHELNIPILEYAAPNGAFSTRQLRNAMEHLQKRKPAPIPELHEIVTTYANEFKTDYENCVKAGVPYTQANADHLAGVEPPEPPEFDSSAVMKDIAHLRPTSKSGKASGGLCGAQTSAGQACQNPVAAGNPNGRCQHH